MKLNIFFIASVLTVLVQTGYCDTAADAPTVMRASRGDVAYSNEEFGWINTVGGSIELKQVWVNNGIMTDENLVAEYSDLTGLSICGDVCTHYSFIRGNSRIGGVANFTHDTIVDQISICGQLNAHDTIFIEPVSTANQVFVDKSHFENSLFSFGRMIDLIQSTAKDIIFLCSRNSSHDSQILRLTKNTIVDGNVYFESGRGIVLIDPSSCILGFIEGGRPVQCDEFYADFADSYEQ